MQWMAHVRIRFQALLAARSKKLDGQIYGLNLAETSIEVEINKNNYTSESYFLGDMKNAGFAASIFEESFVV